MKQHTISRRKALATGLTASLAALSPKILAASSGPRKQFEADIPFRISLNTSTLMGYELDVITQIDAVADAGFDGIELWMRDIQTYLDGGGKAEDLRERLEAGGLVLENIIGFSEWCSDDLEKRKQAGGQLVREMEVIQRMGGLYVAAPVMGISSLDPTQYEAYAERYRTILELGQEVGVLPILELWGMGALHRLADAAHIAIATGHPRATLLLDIYHVYRGGNDWAVVDFIDGQRLPLIHMNDYPASPSWDQLTDADRVLPGEGVCPFDEVVPKLREAGFQGAFSIELFNRGYWESMDATTLLQKSYQTTETILRNALKTGE